MNLSWQRLAFAVAISVWSLYGGSCLLAADEDGQNEILPSMKHLRSGGQREWDTFPDVTTESVLEMKFGAQSNRSDYTLSVRQSDVKQRWDVRLNDKLLGRLVTHEEDLIQDFTIPKGGLLGGVNKLVIRQANDRASDDIEVGEVVVHSLAPNELRSGATLLIDVVDKQQRYIPGRITIVDDCGALVPVHATDSSLAIRHGVVYTGSGKAKFGVRPGKYRIYAGRGFEYSIDHTEVDITKGQTIKRTLVLDRTVDTKGWVACDTHVHTFTHSRHGDCTMEERMVTLAGEGIELPIATDHNKHIDYRATAKATNTEKYFTPVIGNEVTTKLGHFNVFPVASAKEKTPETDIDGWSTLFDGIFKTPYVRVAILNHGRDIHGGFRPFSPRHHCSLSGENLDGWLLKANAMELLNSGATQTDPMELFHDWCGLINRGLKITPVGCSDSHDVSRYIVGQGRTYIRCDDTDAAAIDVDAAVNAFLAGKVIVSYGIMVDVSVGDSTGPGEMLTVETEDVPVQVVVRGPKWCNARRAELFMNGRSYLSKPLSPPKSDGNGVLATVDFAVNRSDLVSDSWLTVVATGDGIDSPHWRTAKPYQPDSIHFDGHTFSCTGPIWIDVDGDKSYSSPLDQAKNIIADSKRDQTKIFNAMTTADLSVAIQVMALLRNPPNDTVPIDLWSNDLSKRISRLPSKTRKAVNEYRRALRDCEIARAESRE